MPNLIHLDIYIEREKERALFFTFDTCVCLAHPQRPCLAKVNLNNFAKNSSESGKGSALLGQREVINLQP